MVGANKQPQGLCLIVMGTSGCGKSSIADALAKDLQAPFLEGDDYHPQSSKDKMASGTPLTDEDRWPWLQKLHNSIYNKSYEIQTAVQSEETEPQNPLYKSYPARVIVACSCLKRSYRNYLASSQLPKELNGLTTLPIKFVFVYLKGAKELIRERMEARKNHFMKAYLLDSQFKDLEEPDPQQENVVVVSIDGNLPQTIELAINSVHDYLSTSDTGN